MDQPNQVPPVSHTPPQHEKNHTTNLVLIIVGIVVFGVVALAIIGAVIAYILTQTVTSIVRDADVGGIVDMIEGEIENEFGDEVDYGETIVDETGGVLTIDWIPVAQQSVHQTEPAFLAFKFDNLNPVEYYELGTVTSGAYKGFNLRLQALDLEGMGMYRFYLYYLSDPAGISKPIVLDRYGQLGGVYFGSAGGGEGVYTSARETVGETQLNRIGDRVVFNTRISIPELKVSTEIKDRSGRLYRYFDDKEVLNERPSGETIFDTTTAGYTLYQAPEFNSLFYIVREDGRPLTYALDIPFWTNNAFVAKPKFNWPNGVPAGEYANGMIGGCGFEMPISIVKDVGALGTLRAVTVSSGHTVYVPEDLENEYFTARYKNWVFQGTASFEDYADITPFFYWKDQIGRTLEFTHVDVLPAAECGKPVIYLYPEEEMEVDVTVAPKGGFTFTEPAYNDGWTVTAKPNGQLTNKADGKKYPYLFWEGRGGLYQAPEQYWVIERKEVRRFLRETLADYGLNRKEIADFNEFWVPRMKEAEFYKIGFHGTAVMDDIAPLTVSGGPETIFRILMDFDELEAPIPENPPKRVVPFERKGFTVVEWGGVIE